MDQSLAQLVRSCREAMRPYPITLLSDELLHTTIEMVADTTADRMTGDDRDALAEAMCKHLKGAVPFQVMAGSPIANKAGALLDLSPDAPLVDLRSRVREAFREARGTDAVRERDGGRPHMSLGYSWDTASSDTLQSALRRITPSHAPFHVDHVQLFDVQFRERARHPEAAAWEISWQPVATIPLGCST
ncbi:hypothetical protein GZL_02387 [Streptomyces sp. 769]|nr:hypothetical protein GZL_02387 [Streptomyces sp. 769]